MIERSAGAGRHLVLFGDGDRLLVTAEAEPVRFLAARRVGMRWRPPR